MRGRSKIIAVAFSVFVCLGNFGVIHLDAAEDQSLVSENLEEKNSVKERQVVENVIANLTSGIETYFEYTSYDLEKIQTLQLHTIDGYKLNNDDLIFLKEKFHALSVLDVGQAEFESTEYFELWEQYCEQEDICFISDTQLYMEETADGNTIENQEPIVSSEVNSKEISDNSFTFHGICVVERGIHVELGASYETDESGMQFRWLVYDLEKQIWQRVSEFSDSNWITWTPERSGDYWICVEIKNSKDEVVDYISAYTWEGIVTRLTGMCIDNKGTYLEAGVVFESSDPDIRFEWLEYDLLDQKWRLISEPSESNWVTWTPKTPGRYWLCVHAIDTVGNVTEYICDYTWKGFTTNISGIYVIDRGSYFDMGACYSSDDSDLQFQWKIYNLEKQQWEQLQGLSLSNWTTWTPHEQGNYWIHVETLDRNGCVVSYTIPYYFKGVSTELQQICVNENEETIDMGIAYTSNDAELQFRWLLYDVVEEQWRIISDWSSGNWSTWKPDEEGEYWFWVEARTYDGDIIQKSLVYKVNKAGITSFNVLPDSPNWIGEKIQLVSECRDFFDQIYSSRFLIYDGIKWEVIAENIQNTEWIASELGEYLFCYEIYDENGQLMDQKFKAYNIEKPYVNLKDIYVIDNDNLNISMGAVNDSNDKEVEFRWLYYDITRGEWHTINNWNSSNWVNWKAPDYGDYWLHVEARLNNGEIETYTISYSILKEPQDVRTMRLRANLYSSLTPYILMVNRSTHKVGVFQGWQGNWQCIRYWDCSDGAPSTPTVEGVFRVGSRGYYFDSGASRCFWYTQFYGDYLFHSVLYSKYNGSLMDGRLGMALSHGCVRLDINNAKWIYDTIPSGTTVVVYH